MTYNSRPKQIIQVPLDKLLFAIATLYFGLTLVWLFNQTQHRPANVAQPRTNSDREFITHLEKSLETIDRETATAKAAKLTPQTPPVPPVVKIAPPPPANPPQSREKPVERIYIPVYPQNPSSSKNAPPPPPVVSVAPSTIPTRTIIATGGKLVGVLELGDRSSALFDVNGVTRRIAIGENVNGWIVVGVQNQQVLLSRGSTTRVINLGQSI